MSEVEFPQILLFMRKPFFFTNVEKIEANLWFSLYIRVKNHV